MKRKILTIVAVTLMLLMSIFVLTGCGEKSGIVGKWQSELGGYTYDFKNDGTGTYNMFGSETQFTYTDNGTSFAIKYAGSDYEMTLEYRIEGNKLIVKDSFGKDTNYIKK